jgi:Zn-dependent peptidase ImmA (M78 family)
MAYLEDEDFEVTAKRLRVKLEVDDQILLDVITLLRKLKHDGYISNYIRVPDNLMPNAEAKFDPDQGEKGTMFIRESVYAAAQKGEHRARWTICHEIGHVALNHRWCRNRSSIPLLIEKIAPTIRRDETQANRFAAALIAPFHRSNFSPQTTPSYLATRFGLSIEAATLRIEELSRIYRRRNAVSRQLPDSVVDLLAVLQRKGNKIKDPALADLVSNSPNLEYEGNPCPCCGQFKMVRTGINTRCQNCGAMTGDD